jgi:GntR family transcriptional regulator
LTEEGLVTAQHGRGVFVRKKQGLLRRDAERYSRRTYRATALTPFRLEMAREGKTARVEVTSIEQVIPPLDIAERLKTSPEEPSVLRRCNAYYADDQPLQVVTTYIRWSDAEGTLLLQPKTGPGGIYGRLEERGHTMTSGQDEIIARMARHDEAQILDLPAGVPVLEVLHISLNQDDEPFEVSRFVHRADRTGLIYRFPVES